MAYPLNSYAFTPGSAGFNYNHDLNQMAAGCMVDGSVNINIRNNYTSARGGTEIVYSLPELSPVSSLYEVIDQSFEPRIISTTEPGNIYKDDVLLKSTGSSIQNATYVMWNGNLIINGGSHIPQVWDRASASTTDFPTAQMAADWVLDNQYPEVMVIYGKGNAVRAWATKETLRGTVLYYSAINDGSSAVPNFRDGDFFYVSTPSDEPLTALQEFGDKLIFFCETKAFILDDASSIEAEWGYIEAPWDGGALSQRVVIKTENDILCLVRDGTIYSLTAVMAYGDYKISSITNSANINNFIRERFNHPLIDQMHVVFDPRLRNLKFFGPSSFSQENDTALVYSIDKLPETGWSVHNNELFKSGYDARCSCTVNSGYRKVLCGDYNGKIWALEDDTLKDGGDLYPIKIITPFINNGDFRTTKRFKRGFITVKSPDALSIKVYSRTEESGYSSHGIEFPSGESVFDLAVWDFSYFESDETLSIKYPINKIGIAIQHIYELAPYLSEDCARFDFDFWDDGIFCGGFGNSPFDVLTVTTDFTQIAQRI